MNSDNRSRPHASVPGARPVVLVRYRFGATGQTGSTAHLLPLPPSGQLTAADALCGTFLHPDQIETVTPGQSVPCALCLLSQVAQHPPAPVPVPSVPAPNAPAPGLETTGTDAGPLITTADYRRWDWPVTLHHDRIWLNLDHDAVALIIPTPLAIKVTTILTTRRCSPAVLAHPYAPEHQVFLAGEPYGVDLPCPPGVHRVTATLLLPPTMTPRGPVIWIYPPQANSLRFCREIDLFGALRTALPDPLPE